MSGLLGLLLPLTALQGSYAVIPTSDEMSQSDLRLAYHTYGECIIKGHMRRAAEAILSNADDEALFDYRELFAGSCFHVPPGWLTMFTLHADHVRYAIADALVAKQLATQPAPNLASVPLLDHRDPGPPPTAGRASEASLSAYKEKRAFSVLSQFGECAVRTDVAAAKALLLTEPESKEEAGAFTRLTPALANCMPEGETVTLTKLPLRGTIAVNYYRLARAAGPAPAGKSK
jgi:hypothetical protein